MKVMHPAILLAAFGLLVSACGGATVRKEIEGNNTGGSIPANLVKGGNAQALADAHCARWSTRARITFSGTDSGGDTVFVCETASGPALFGTPPADTKAAPAPKQAPAKR
jgi:hypothetical protein